MYKFLLCWRYLRTRYIALASVISVMLGVATMIVVNSVMEGFAHEMQGRIHSILSDLVVDSISMEGVPDANYQMEKIRSVAGEYIAGMTPTVVVPAMLTFQLHGQVITRHVNLIGVDEATHAQVSDFGRYLQHPANRAHLTFGLHEAGYDVKDHQAGADAAERPEMERAGWMYRRWNAERLKANEAAAEKPAAAEVATNQADESPATEGAEAAEGGDPFKRGTDPFGGHRADVGQVFDPAKEQHTGLVLGIGLGSYRAPNGQDRFLVLPGDDVNITVPTAGSPPKGVSDKFTVVDFYESKMSEYDSTFVFVPIRKLQEMRGMIDPATGVGSITSIQIKLHDDKDGALVRDKLRTAFSPNLFSVQTWRDKQGPLLAAVQMETAILNVLLFMIIAVAGFGILAIFFMIVVEKTRDIGILKSLGAPSGGIMGIFLTYGLSLGMVGSGVGMIMGLLFVAYINDIANGLSWITGQPVFDPSIYYFQKIPTIVDPFTVTWIVCGAMLIAVMASILPARRAARLHPVEALRYE